MSTENLLEAWGCPEAYRSPRGIALGESYDDVDMSANIRDLARQVSSAANWYDEMDLAIADMIRVADATAIRSWDRDALLRIGRETGASGETEVQRDTAAESYADEIMAALEALAAEIESTPPATA